MRQSVEVINTQQQSLKYTILNDSVETVVYPRIHMFPIDLSLISGIIKNGGFGYSLKNMPITVSVQKCDTPQEALHIEGGIDVENLDFTIDFDALRSYIASDDHYSVRITAGKFLREHTGLGTSTQIIGGVYGCCAKLSGADLKIRDLYNLGLGHNSALGLNLLFNPGMAFEVGTKVTEDDDGIIAKPTLSQKRETVANTLYKVNAFPFYSIIAVPKQASSITDEFGESYLDNITLPIQDIDSYRIVYTIFEHIIPSIVESDYVGFISGIQEAISLGSKAAEEDYESESTRKTLEQLRSIFGFAAVSSLGPTLYSFSEHNPLEEMAKMDSKDYDFLVYTPSGKVKKLIGKGETLLIASFAAMGKTTFANNYPDIALDVESIHYEREYIATKDPDDEVAKNDNNWTRNPNYPGNYIQDVLNGIGKYKVIFLTLAQPVLGELDRLDITYKILYPGPNRKQQILLDSGQRGNDQDFVDFLDGLLSTPDHREEFESFQHEHFEIIDDNTYMEKYLNENYYF